MKKVKVLVVSLLLIVFMSCSSDKNVIISLTNPQSIAVDYTGYYQVESTGDSVALVGTTPATYELAISKGDQVSGQIYKSDNTNYTDTLFFQVFIDEEEYLSQKTTSSVEIIMFQFSVQ